MTREMKIDKGIPIPNPPKRWKGLAEQMQVGDSILIGNTSEEAAIVSALKRLYQTDNEQVTTRHKEKNGIRVWRIK